MRLIALNLALYLLASTAAAQTYTVTTAAGSGAVGDDLGGFSGDGGPANQARLNNPIGVVQDLFDNLFYIADTKNNRFRAVRHGTISTQIGFTNPGPIALSRDRYLVTASTAMDVLLAFGIDAGTASILVGQPVPSAGLPFSAIPRTITLDSFIMPFFRGEYLYFGEANGMGRMHIPSVTYELFIGSGGRFPFPKDYDIVGIGADLAGNLYFTRPEAPSRKVVKMTPQGDFSYPGETLTGPDARPLWQVPTGVSQDFLGNIFIVDTGRSQIFRLNTSGQIDLIGDTSLPGFSGDGGPATQAQFRSPLAISCGLLGTPCYVTDTLNHRIRKLEMVVPAPAINAGGIANGASYAGGAVAPGEIVALFGTNLAPSISLARLDQGRLATENNGVRVLFDGVLAPIVWVNLGQISVVVPSSVSGRTTTNVVVEVNGRASAPLSVAVTPVAPALFTANSTGRGPGSILNQDNALNTATNTAARGGVVVLYGTGAGQTNPAGVDGKLTVAPLPRPVLPVTATIGGLPAEVLYAGGAPSQVAGLWQVNLQVPAGLTPGAHPVVVRVGGVASQDGVTVAVR